jgi:hypothetical protein
LKCGKNRYILSNSSRKIFTLRIGNRKEAVMGNKKGFFLKAFCIGAAIVTLMIAGCGGGGGSSSGNAGAEGATGSVSLLLNGSSIDTSALASQLGVDIEDGESCGQEYEHVYITITKIELLGEDESKGIVLLTSGNGCTFDLMDMDGKDLVLTLKQEVPAGTYTKIRVTVSKVETEGGECDLDPIKVPSGKIDFLPSSAFTVQSGSTVYIRLDVDARKSFHLHEAGSSGKCVFRPVVFCTIHTEMLESCPELITGTITSLIDIDLNLIPEEIIVERDCPCLPDANVSLTSETVIFSENGTVIEADDLEEGMDVTVFAAFNPQTAKFDARFVVVGAVSVVKGTLNSVEQDYFIITADPGQALQGSLKVVPTDDTARLGLCGEEETIWPVPLGTRLTLVGRYDTVNAVFDPYAVLVHPY